MWSGCVAAIHAAARVDARALRPRVLSVLTGGELSFTAPELLALPDSWT
jgi:hypothetical protein